MVERQHRQNTENTSKKRSENGRRFQPVLVPEPTRTNNKMLKALKDKYEAFHRVGPDL